MIPRAPEARGRDGGGHKGRRGAADGGNRAGPCNGCATAGNGGVANSAQ